MNVHQGDSRLEKFIALVSQAFPDQPEVKELSPANSLNALWSQVAGITGLEQSQIAEKLAHQAGIKYLPDCEVNYQAMQVFPPQFVQKRGIIPAALEGDRFIVAISNPFDEELMGQIDFITEHKTEFVINSPLQVEEALHDYFSSALLASGRHGVLVIQKGHPAATNEHSIVSLARKLLRKAVADTASDLHIQPYLGGGEVRQRVDGLLRRVALLPESVYEQLCRYFKAASDMDPSNDRITQDGRLSLSIDDAEFELRISTLPVKGGERLVIRFLNQQQEFNLTQSGIATGEIQKLRQMVVNPAGIILLTGPTGSGKTSTLYSLLGEINSPNINIITIENPVENTIPTISQVDVNEKAGLTFAHVLRTVLRQDPDVILLGEIRDSETAKVATQAALTGHLVLSTVHTNDALSALTRLQDLGIKETVIADSLIGVVSQRLCRKLCEACKIDIPDKLLAEEEAFKQITKIAPASRKVGCIECDFTGYSGRFPVTEILHVGSARDRELIKSGEIHQIHSAAGKINSLESIASSAARHVMSGDTSVEEVSRVIGANFWKDLSSEYGVEVPDGVLSLGSQMAQKAQNAILVLAGDEAGSRLKTELESQWFEIIHVATSAEAKEKLKSLPDIVFVIVDIADDLDDDAAVKFVRQARVDMAWSRLPALLLLPEGKGSFEKPLRDDGAISPCLVKPFAENALLTAAQNALAE